jgi:hypothetical protein
MSNLFGKSNIWLAMVLFFFCSLTVAAAATETNNLQSMKLLTSQVGWVANERHLFWTTTAGESWKEITPKMSSTQIVGGVFFLNTSNGWVLLSYSDQKDEQQFEIASTTNAGETWSTSPIILPWDRYAEDFSGGGTIYFVDYLHGWANLDILSASLSPARLLYTEDGGKTWNATLDDPGRAGSFCFFGKSDGILAGGPQSTELWITHDASTIWRQSTLMAPQAAYAGFPTYGHPVCQDSKHGFLPVTYTPTMYPNHESFSTILVLFETNDAGRNWKVDRILPSLPNISHGYSVTSSLADSIFFAIAKSGISEALFTVNSQGVTTKIPAPNLESALILDFVDAFHGWALTSTGVLSTTDGGVTWQHLSVPNNAPLARSLSAVQLSQSLPALGPSSQAPIPSAKADTRLGFDTKFVPSSNDMLAWFLYSPYFDYQISLPGAANHKTNKGLDSSWVTAVVNYGWGLWPVWVGPQAPCVNQPKLVHISSKNPYAQGQQEATSAIAQLTKLGFVSQTVIYYDMENYNTSNSGCRTIVRNFLNGWINQLQAKGYQAGVYGNIAPAVLDFSKLTPLPDDAWITWGPAHVPPNIPHVSIWGLGTKTSALCDPFTQKPCNLWSMHQRMHQYVIDTKTFPHYETYHGVKLEIDPDLVDAAVAIPSSEGKGSLTFDYSSIDYPSAKLTNALGINNIGDIVGYYYFLSSAKHGFLLSNNNYTSIEYPGAAQTEAWGINDIGKIVGFYIDSQNNFNGFTVSPPYGSQDYMEFSLGDNTFTVGLGINDNGQIAGYYHNSTGYHGFLYNNSTGYTTIDDGGNGTTLVRNLDGNAYIVGLIQGGNGFLYNPISQQFVSLSVTMDGVNDSFGMVGENTLYDYPTNTQITLDYPGSLSTGAFGINDYIHIVGNWSDSNSVQHGFLATPKQ